MTELTLRCQHLSEIDHAARTVLDFGQNVEVWLFEGEMGAGKTTFIQALCRQLGVVGAVQSPTFALVNEYGTAAGDVVYHFDFYRIKSEIEALDLGVEEYFDSGDLCFVEWPSKIPNLWPSEHLKISITACPDESRRIELVRVALNSQSSIPNPQSR